MKASDLHPSKYLKATDLHEDGQHLTMRYVITEKVRPDEPQKGILFVEEFDKGIVLNKTNTNNIAKVYGDEMDDWGGKKIWAIPTWVDFQGESTLSIRLHQPKRSAGQQQPQARTKVNDPELNRQARDERNAPPHEEIPGFD